ncbi:MAG TPA: response regulator transcription factor [Solirubrobacteraceae bacterium]
MSRPIRVVVGSDDPLRRTGITHALREARIDIVAAASDAADLVRKARAHRPDLAVIDRQMKPSPVKLDGAATVRNLRSIDPAVAVLILSEHADERYVLEVVGDQPQGFGFLVNGRIGDIEEFTAAVQRVARGGVAIDPGVISRLAGSRPTDGSLEDLTVRERQVLALMAEGRSNQFIAGELVVTTAAVERHITSIYAKLGLRSNGDDHRRVLAILRYVGGTQRIQPHIRSWG